MSQHLLYHWQDYPSCLFYFLATIFIKWLSRRKEARPRMHFSARPSPVPFLFRSLSQPTSPRTVELSRSSASAPWQLSMALRHFTSTGLVLLPAMVFLALWMMPVSIERAASSPYRNTSTNATGLSAPPSVRLHPGHHHAASGGHQPQAIAQMLEVVSMEFRWQRSDLCGVSCCSTRCSEAFARPSTTKSSNWGVMIAGLVPLEHPMCPAHPHAELRQER